ncbi:MAG TPA: tannase/feruloyl esterase family alpha/beta hydrolase, partial [Vicinamibacteria bacterium]|nr:tannase/feruloyl esterase family alpha/beta hydrolase [Vicinamibacteria bacterium]
MNDPRCRPLPIVLLLSLSTAPALAATCESVSKLALPGTTIVRAQAIPAGPFTLSDGPPIADMAAFCRVSGTIKPTADSDIQFEVWLPASGWNGRFKGFGNGGFAGSMSLRSLG